ncbi:hypothetical protein HYDPIDRAFT_175201 [Hydnomerulius pinastri MD-312]|uniref:DNL-type domain-containing protein n=1 Tax=Hydnomerulius pinastri MD-312 TaxID=994086 RepID=A0A0C9W2H2_9AGAM|nr:hypothetical protein HYDPIDRAFT_175201 [Hydnomerulius pinastri MD-312]
MLPSRLFRNVGLAPSLRPALATCSVSRASALGQARLRFGTLRANSSAAGPSQHKQGPAQPSVASPSSTPAQQVKFDPAEPRLAIAFTCTADDCNHRSAHTFTKRSYERGIVIIQCPSCKNRHLIADHLGWFKDDTAEGKLRTIEDILRARGEEVRRGNLDGDGVVEFSDS